MSERRYKSRSVNDHDFDTIQHVEGVIVDQGEMDVGDGRKGQFIVIDAGEYLSRIWRSYDLEEPFKLAKLGDHISIEYVGMVKTKTAGRQMREFKHSLWTE